MKTKRRCPTVATSDGATDEYSSLWTTSLPGDLLLLVAWRVLTGDFPCGVAGPRFHLRRWIMFPEGYGLDPGHNKLRSHLRFLNLDTGTFVRVKLPHFNFNNHCILDSVDGLLLLQRDHDTAVCLLQPFTGDLAELPTLSSLEKQLRRYQYNHYYNPCYHHEDQTSATGGSLSFLAWLPSSLAMQMLEPSPS